MSNDFENKITKCDELKLKLDSLRPLKDEELDQLKSYFRVGQTYSSNALEGNTLTEVETKVIIEDGLTVSGKPLREIFEATAARLLMNLILVQAGYTVAIIPPIYRVQYLEVTRKGNDGIHKPFTDLLSCMLYESQKDLLRMLGE